MIPPSKQQSKILVTKMEICRAFQIGEKRLEIWIQRGLPVKKVDGQWMGHYDAIEKFIKIFLETTCQ